MGDSRNSSPLRRVADFRKGGRRPETILSSPLEVRCSVALDKVNSVGQSQARPGAGSTQYFNAQVGVALA